MLTNEDLVRLSSENVLPQDYTGMTYSVFTKTQVRHYIHQQCYGSMPAYITPSTQGVIIWLQGDTDGVAEFSKLVQSEDFFYRDLKIEIITVDQKVGFVWRYDPESPLNNWHPVMSFFKMCRQFTEHRPGGKAFKILVENGMKPMLAIYLCQFYRATGNKIQFASGGFYHGAWADNMVRIMWAIYHDRLCDVALNEHSAIPKTIRCSYGGCDGYLAGVKVPKSLPNSVGSKPVNKDYPVKIELVEERGSFSQVPNIVKDIPAMVKAYHDYLDALAPDKTSPNPEDEDF